MTTLSWLSRSLRHFLYSSSVYSCHLFWISSASVRSKNGQFTSFMFLLICWVFYLFIPYKHIILGVFEHSCHSCFKFRVCKFQLMGSLESISTEWISEYGSHFPIFESWCTFGLHPRHYEWYIIVKALDSVLFLLRVFIFFFFFKSSY